MVHYPVSQEARLAIPEESFHKEHSSHCPEEEIFQLKETNSIYVYGKVKLTRISHNSVTFSVLATLQHPRIGY